MATLKDKVIGGFRVLAEIQAGSGSQGTVYKAVCDEDKFGLVRVGTVVALKVMPVQDEGQAQWRKLVKRTRELANLRHPNVVKYHGCFSEQGTFNDVHVVVQEFLNGETLKERLARHPSGLDVDEAKRIAEAALSGLIYTAERCKIVHRDIKPGNIFLCLDESGAIKDVKLIDFEIAQQAGGGTTSTAGNIRGSFDYMAPDFTDADFHGDMKSDVFSFGVVLHEMLCGKTPYQRLSGADNRQANFAFLARWAHPASRGPANPIHVSSRIRRLLAHTEEVFSRSLAPKRDERYADFSAFLDDVRKIRFRNLHNGDATYQILQFIGKGGFGEVFKARLKQTGQLVAVKHLLKEEYAVRFRREAKIMKKLSSPCFVRLVDFFQSDISGNTESFLVMAFLDGMPGSSLRDAIKRDGGKNLDAKSVFIAFGRYARGLRAMHKLGIFHRDIKPSNLYYPQGHPERAAIMDLGIARDMNGTATYGQVPGTLDYMPPEVVLSDNRGDAGMDVYALGLCFYEALTGKTAYPRLPTGTSGYAVFFDRAKRGLPPSFDAPQVSGDEEVLSLLREMTAVDPSQRLSDADVIVSRLGEIVGTRFADAARYLGGQEDEGETTEAATSEMTATITRTLTQNPATRGTATTQPGSVEAIGRERDARRRARSRRVIGMVAKAASLAAALAAIAFGVYYYALPLMRRPGIADVAVAKTTGVVTNATDIGTGDTGVSANVPDIGIDDIGVVTNVAVAVKNPEPNASEKLAADILELLDDRPIANRLKRISEAEEKLNNAKCDNEELVANLRDHIASARKRVIGYVTNATANAIFVAGRKIKSGERELFNYEDGLPTNWFCRVDGYDNIDLDTDIEGRTIVVDSKDLNPRAVEMRLPKLEDGVSCLYNGNEVTQPLKLRPGEYVCRYTRRGYADQNLSFTVKFNEDGTLPNPADWDAKAVKVTCQRLASGIACKVDGTLVVSTELMLTPGNHSYEYSREDYKVQKGTFSVEVAKDRDLPPPDKWVQTDGLKALDDAKVAVEKKDWLTAKSSLEKADVVSADNKKRKEHLDKQLKDKLSELAKKTVDDLKPFMESEPVEARKNRLAAALDELDKSIAIIPADQVERLKADIEARKRWVVGKVINNTQTPLTIDGNEIAPEDGKVFVFKDGLLPEVWKCVAKGYDPIDINRDFDERTIIIGNGDLKPRAVEMRLPKLEDGVSCLYDDKIVMQPLKLRPGQYVCRYTRQGYEDQDIPFAVLFDKDGTLPQPQSWRAKPVSATVPLLGEGIVCRVDERIVTDVVQLRPGEHNCIYERLDYKPQAKKFSVVAGVNIDLPPLGEWEQTEGLKNLVGAQKAIGEKDWKTADRLLSAADVVSEENKKLKGELVAQSEKQVTIQKKVEAADVYFNSLSYYQGVMLYYEAAQLGYDVPKEKKGEIVTICDSQITHLNRQIEKLKEQIELGRNHFRDLNKLEEKRDEFVKWKTYFSR